MKIKLLSVGLFLVCAAVVQAKPTESNLIAYAQSGDFGKMKDALDRLPNMYPNSTNAIAIIKGILRSNETIVVTERVMVSSQKPLYRKTPHVMVVRIAARSLGNYHTTLNEIELNIIYNKLLKSRDEEDAMDGLKALRGMNAPEAIPLIIPLLEDGNTHVVRDSIRTLGVIGNKSTIRFIEPLMQNSRSDIKWDALAAIQLLKSKPN